MPSQTFQVSYGGTELSSGAMDVYDLAPALLAIGNLVRHANDLLNGEQATVDVKVDSDFKKGSFEIHLILDQHLLETALQPLSFAAVVDINGILQAIFGLAKEHEEGAIGAVIIGLFKLYKLLRGEK